MEYNNIKEELGELLEQNYPQDRLNWIQAQHDRSFHWQSVERIPLGVIVVNPSYSLSNYPGLDDPRPFFQLQAQNLLETVAVNSDIIPTVGLESFGAALIPSMFGCKLRLPSPEERVTSIAYVGPWIEPMVDDIKMVWNLDVPDLDSGIMPQVCEALAFYRENLPEQVWIATPFKIEPFTCAALMRGPDIYTDLFYHPDETRRLLDLCAETLVATEKYMRRKLGVSDDFSISHTGVYVRGLRLNADTVINLSPEQIRSFVLPAWRKIAASLGGSTYPHFCSTAFRLGEQIYEAVVHEPTVIAVSTQFGIPYYENHCPELFGRLAIESGYTGANAINYFEDMATFKDWAFKFIGLSSRTGIVLYTVVDSVAKGQELMAIWKNAWEREGKGNK